MVKKRLCGRVARKKGTKQQVRYRISEIKIDAKEYADEPHRMEHIERALRKKLRKKSGGKSSKITNIEIIRESIDARHKPDVKAVYTLDFDCREKLSLPEGGIEEYRPLEIPGTDKPGTDKPAAAAEEENPRPVVIGFGPCGIFAALVLAEAGLRPIVIERGRPAAQRAEDVRRFWEEGILDPESNVQFGEGGAGTFSDGKLTTGIRNVRIRKVLQEFVRAGADPQILYQQRPHIGTDRLQQIIPRIRERIEMLGGEVRFETKLVGLETAEPVESAGATGAPGATRSTDAVTEPGTTDAPGATRLTAVLTETRSGCRGKIYARCAILAIGHSARDTFRMLRGLQIPMEQKAFSIGVRIEHPQESIDAAQYGDPELAKIFGPAIYKLSHRCENGRGVYTFCMCPGGKVINAASEEGGMVTNGMSESGRDSGTANAGLLVDVRTEDFGSEDPLAGVEFQRTYEQLALEQGRGFPGGLPKTDYRTFRERAEDPVRKSLPAFAAEAIIEAMPHLGRKLKGFDADDAKMTAVETRSSSPVRILRDEEMQTVIRGLIPAGEGPGYAGGIMSAAVDGICAAEQIIREQWPENRKK